DQHEQRERAEEVPEVEVLRRVVTGQLLVYELIDRQALVEPRPQALLRRRALRQPRRCAGCGLHRHQATPFSSAPITSVRAPMSGVRRTTEVGELRRRGVATWAGSSLERSSSVGAPWARARSEGLHDAVNGTAASTVPAAPVAIVARVRSLRRLRSTSSSATTA